MIRLFVAACILSCLAASALAQGRPSTAAPTVKPAKEPAPKAKTSAALPKATDSGPCRIGVISAIGDEFVVQRIGLTVFGNEYT
jgi:hypothetical protein